MAALLVLPLVATAQDDRPPSGVSDVTLTDAGLRISSEDGRDVLLRVTDEGLTIEEDGRSATAPRVIRLQDLLRSSLQANSLSLTQEAGLLVRSDIDIERDQVVHGVVVATDGDIRVAGRIEGSAIALRGDVRVHDGGHVTGDVLAPRGTIHRDGTIEGRAFAAATSGNGRTLAQTGSGLVTLFGTVLALAALGFGATLLAPSQLDVGAETLGSSLGRSLATGLLGQALLLPTLVTLIVGLAVTVVGIIVVPFAVVGFMVLALAAALSGLLSVFRVVGERMAGRTVFGIAVGQGAFSQFIAGMTLFALLWLVAVLLQWVPIAGLVLVSSAALITWVAFTAGFGAALLSRLGTRDGFAGRMTAELTDEYLWPTPIATRAARRPQPRNR